MTDPATLSWLAGAVAGRAVRIVDNGNGIADSDGVSIRVSSTEADWRSVAAQAVLIAAGTYAPGTLRLLIGRPDLAGRYALIELVRAVDLCRDRLPNAFLTAIPGAIPVTSSPAASLALAKAGIDLPPNPTFLAPIRTSVVLARLTTERRSFRQSPAPPTDDARLKPPAPSTPAQQENSALLRLFASPLGGRSGDGEQTTDAGGGETPVSRFRHALRRGLHAVRSRWEPQADPSANAASALACLYPEWDLAMDSLRPDRVTVEESEPLASETSSDGDFSPSSLALRRQLAKLGVDHEPHGRQREGADLDTRALIEAAIDLRAGREPASLDIYRATRRTRRDLGVVIVLDASDSTDDAAPEGPSAFDLQSDLACQLAHAFTALGDPTALFAFQSWGRSFVRVSRLKHHDERWTGHVAERLNALEPMGFTRTGAAIRHATRRLTHEMRLPNRLLILITDGVAYDSDYEGRQASTDIRNAIEAARAEGCACVCLSVGPGADVAGLSGTFGAAGLIVADDIERVIARIGPICRAALAGVSERRPVRRAT